MPIVCGGCGNAIPDSAVYCPKCGAKIDVVPDQVMLLKDAATVKGEGEDELYKIALEMVSAASKLPVVSVNREEFLAKHFAKSADFEQILGVKTVLMGFGLESNAIHSPNENIPLDIIRKGIEAVVEFHRQGF